MIKSARNLLLAALAGIVLASCSVFEPETPPLNRVTIMYAAAVSNLSAAISEDIEDICNGTLPSLESGDVFLVYSHMPVSNARYSTPSSPVLFRAWEDNDGTHHRDTLITYPANSISSTVEVMHQVLSDAQRLFPAPHFGMIISSHGKGWIPKGYEEPIFNPFSVVPSSAETKEICIESVSGSGINIDDLPNALPMKMDYIIMDSCLMGCVETAYELRGKCDLLLFSPTEILSDGMMYHTMGPLLTNIHNPNIKQVARDYFNHYNELSGSYRSATISVVDVNAIEPLASVCKKLTGLYRQAIYETPSSNVQPYFYNSLHWYFDLRDIYVQAGINEEELAELDAAISDAVLYEAHTEEFLGVKMERVCGLSMYKPYNNLSTLNEYYSNLAWNKAIGLL